MSFLKDLFKRKEKPNDITSNLYAIPRKDSGVNVPHIRDLKEGYVQQADLLHLPNDGGNIYALVVVDTASRKTDAVPLKNKEAHTVLEGLKKIYRRGILHVPKSSIEVDSGSEFKGEVAEWFRKNKCNVRIAKPYRHRQQGLVERRNQTIAHVLFKRMTAQELVTGHPSTEWVDDLSEIIAEMNKHYTKLNKKVKLPDKPVCEGDACRLLAEGTKVRVALDAPVDVLGNKLHGRFRSTDVRWDPKIRTINQLGIVPNQPPLYYLDGNVGRWRIDPVGYTKNQLQVVSENEQQPKENGGKYKREKYYVVQKILKRKTVGSKTSYLVQWEGYDSPSWESETSLMQDVPALVKSFNKNNP